MQERSRAFATTWVADDELTPQARAAVASVEVPATEVLITEQELDFSTAAARAARRQGAGHPLLTRLWRLLARSATAAHRRPYVPPNYLERARLSREMDRL